MCDSRRGKGGVREGGDVSPDEKNAAQWAWLMAVNVPYVAYVDFDPSWIPAAANDEEAQP